MLTLQWFQFLKIKKIFLSPLKGNEGEVYKVSDVNLAGDLR